LKAQILDPNLEEILIRLDAEFHPAKVYLFGSRARRDENIHSDYDIMVVLKESKLTRIERLQKAREVLWSTHLAVDVLVYTESEVEELKANPYSVVAAALEEGQIIYAA
jgi:uncharacterized protein